MQRVGRMVRLTFLLMCETVNGIISTADFTIWPLWVVKQPLCLKCTTKLNYTLGILNSRPARGVFFFFFLNAAQLL